jgi:hypothetical protein
MTGYRTDAHRRRVDLSRRSDRAAVVAILVAVAIAVLIWSPGSTGRRPGDPAAVASDARLARCGGSLSDIEYAFAIPRARDYQTYLPAMDDLSELNIDPPALVVIYRGEFPDLAVGATPTPAPSDPTLRNICIYVGDAGSGEINYYPDVSIAGLRVTEDGPIIVAGPAN